MNLEELRQIVDSQTETLDRRIAACMKLLDTEGGQDIHWTDKGGKKRCYGLALHRLIRRKQQSTPPPVAPAVSPVSPPTPGPPGNSSQWRPFFSAEQTPEVPSSEPRGYDIWSNNNEHMKVALSGQTRQPLAPRVRRSYWDWD